MPAIGIDLGTTYSCVFAVQPNGDLELVETPEGNELTPSVVHFSGSAVSVGADAKKQMADDPDNVVVGIKRYMGKDYPQEYGGVSYTPESISAIILRRLAEDAAQQLRTGTDSLELVITVPAYFGVAEKEATFAAAEIAGVKCLELLAEPVAAAYAYGAADSAGSSLVFDLGGGTFDVAVVAATPGGAPRVWAVDGESQLGGLDWDRRMTALMWDKIEAVVEDIDDCRYDDEFVALVESEAERVKRELSVKESATARLKFGPKRFSITMTRPEFEAASRDLVLQCHASVERVVQAAQRLGAPTVARILLVGGSTRLPMIREELANMLNVPVMINDPDKIVAKGAATLAAKLVSAGSQRRLLGAGERITSVLPRSIGVLIYSSRTPWREEPYVQHVLRANTPLPIVDAKFTVSAIFDGQEKARIQLYEQAGAVESDNAADNRMVFDCEVSGMRKVKAGSEIYLLVSVAADGRISVKASDFKNHELEMQAFIEGTLDNAEVQQQRNAVAGLALRS